MTTHEEFKAELMKDWQFRFYWYLPKYLLIRILMRLLNRLSGLDEVKE